MGYADHPDGTECFHKIWEVAKRSTMLGLVVSTYDVMLYSRTQGYAATLACYARHTVPFFGAGATFAAVTCLSCSLRGKDDKLNYFYGGLSAGGIFGAARKSFSLGIPLGLALGVAAMFYKDSLENKWNLIYYRTPRKYGTFNNLENDYTLTK
ncbi:NADH dehydrogenase (ubiquinone) B14.7 subunit [Oratosquilla oratoria]|uniref:NADH dehydrogenase (ubiquinone) B14.7 subunit n=1 Tax=Oratosquilla oratoria TaxID=337810 RepID=UPI003F769954